MYQNETGRVVPSLCEELTRFRRARTNIHLPPTRSDAVLYLLARPHQLQENPLHIVINGDYRNTIHAINPLLNRWYEVSIPAIVLRQGTNQVELYTETVSMTGWSVALESGGASSSFVTDDGGTTWRSERMGYLNAIQGNYCVRIRLQEGADEPVPDMIWESANHPRVLSLRNRIPQRICQAHGAMEQVRGLASWIAESWEHTASGRAYAYAPWDAETILDWGGAQIGHDGRRPIAMCVHYAVAFASACQAMRIPARCAVLTGEQNACDGHFVAEVWIDQYQKWIMVDPNCDLVFIQHGIPLSIDEIQMLGDDLSAYVDWGPAARYQMTFEHIRDFIRNNLLRGVCFRHRSIWPRSDFISHPENSPPGHGSITYCESDLVWESKDLSEGFGMFRYFASPEYFTAPPDFKVYD